MSEDKIINPDTVVTGKSWEYRLIPATEWRRAAYQEKKIKDGAAVETFASDEARPHFIPLTDFGRKLVTYYTFAGSHGEVLIDGEWMPAGRFARLEEGAVGTTFIEKILNDLDEIQTCYEKRDIIV